MTQSATADAGRKRAPRPALPFITDTDRGPIEHTDTGVGPCLLTVHGGMGGHDQSLLLARALIADPARRRVLAVSRPGYGGTPLVPGATAADQADLFAALLDCLGIERAVVAAVSAGGPSAIEFAARHPDRCAGLILVSTASGAFAVPAFAIRRLKQFRWLAGIPGIARLLAWLNSRAPAKAAARSIRDPEVLARTLAHPEAGPLLLALQQGLFDRLAERLPGTIADTMAFADLPPLPLSRITAPTLVIHGTLDAVVPFAHGQHSARAIAGAEFYAVPDGEHVSLFTHLKAVRGRVDAFLTRIGA